MPATLRVSRRSKYGNVRSGGFASKKQARRFAELKLLERARKIRDLKKEVPIPLHAWHEAGAIYVGSYLADATYFEKQPDGWILIIEDTKSEPTRRNQLYVFKKRFVLAQYGVEIRET